MNVHKVITGVVGAAGLITVLAACSSHGGPQAAVTSDGSVSVSATQSSTPAASSAAVTTPAFIVKPTVAATPPPPPTNTPSVIGFASPRKASPTNTHPTSSAPTLTGPVTFSAVSFPKPFDCEQAGTSYYAAPNVAVALDVTVYVTSQQLAHDLTLAAPNYAPNGISNASQYIGSSSLGHGVWRATYRTYVSLYEPSYTPVAVSSVQASAAGTNYTISFASPVSVTLSNCHS